MCLSFGPRVCSQGPGGLLIVVATCAVWGCGCLGVPIWVSPFWSGPCHMHKPGLKKYSFILWLILIGGAPSSIGLPIEGAPPSSNSLFFPLCLVFVNCSNIVFNCIKFL